jgi:FMN-dependent NADH-azoreductase
MTTILNVLCSPRGAGAGSRRFSHHLLDRLRALHPDAQVVTRDLAERPPPAVDAAFSHAILAPPEADHPALAESEVLIRELEASTILVIATPMHNFSVPSVLKAWIDQIVRIHRTFASTPAGKIGKLPDRPVYVVVASGGWFTQASPAGVPAQPDFLLPYLREVLATIGLRTVHFITLEGMARGTDAVARALQDAEVQLDRLLPPAHRR